MTQPGNPARPARERILETALRLFYAHGPGGVGVDTVIAESGAAKATLYKYFPRKDDLVLAYLDKVDQAWFGGLRAATRTVEHKNVVRVWVTDLARRAGAVDPDVLARQLTLLIDGALASGILDGDPATPLAAKDAAQRLVDAACP